MIDLRHGDCLELMKGIPDGSVDAIITDPPYKVITGGKNKTNATYGILASQDNFGFKPLDIESYIDKLYNLLKENTHIYLFTNVINLENYMTQIRKAGFNIHNVLIWDKQRNSPNRWYMKGVEYIIFARKGKAKSINDKSSKDILKYSNRGESKWHPNSKPVALIEKLVSNSTNENDLVLDFAMGSGSTGVACKNLNRNFIGIEKDDKYFEIAKKRIADAIKDSETKLF